MGVCWADAETVQGLAVLIQRDTELPALGFLRLVLLREELRQIGQVRADQIARLGLPDDLGLVPAGIDGGGVSALDVGKGQPQDPVPVDIEGLDHPNVRKAQDRHRLDLALLHGEDDVVVPVQKIEHPVSGGDAAGGEALLA